MLNAYNNIYALIIQRDFKPNTHILDNEAPLALTNFITKHNAKYQLTPPHVHRWNAAEKPSKPLKTISLLVLQAHTKISLSTYGVGFLNKLTSH